MLTKEQEKWLSHLNDNDRVKTREFLTSTKPLKKKAIVQDLNQYLLMLLLRQTSNNFYRQILQIFYIADFVH